MQNLRGRLFNSIFLVLLFSMFLKGQKSSSTISLSLHATFHNVGAQLKISGNDNNNARAELEVNINNSGFKPAQRLSRINATTFVGTAFNLVPNTNVELRVTLSDPDGVSNASQTESLKTRSDQIPVSSQSKIHVAENGNDGSGNGTASQPYATIQKAINGANAGDKIMLHSGRYHQFTEISYKNRPLESAPITITSAGDGEVLIDGTDLSFNNSDK